LHKPLNLDLGDTLLGLLPDALPAKPTSYNLYLCLKLGFNASLAEKMGDDEYRARAAAAQHCISNKPKYGMHTYKFTSLSLTFSQVV